MGGHPGGPVLPPRPPAGSLGAALVHRGLSKGLDLTAGLGSALGTPWWGWRQLLGRLARSPSCPHLGQSEAQAGLLPTQEGYLRRLCPSPTPHPSRVLGCTWVPALMSLLTGWVNRAAKGPSLALSSPLCKRGGGPHLPSRVRGEPWVLPGGLSAGPRQPLPTAWPRSVHMGPCPWEEPLPHSRRGAGGGLLPIAC